MSLSPHTCRVPRHLTVIGAFPQRTISFLLCSRRYAWHAPWRVDLVPPPPRSLSKGSGKMVCTPGTTTCMFSSRCGGGAIRRRVTQGAHVLGRTPTFFPPPRTPQPTPMVNNEEYPPWAPAAPRKLVGLCGPGHKRFLPSVF